MFENFREYFSAKNTSGAASYTSDEELKLAAASLMFSMILADGKIRPEELVALGEILRLQFNLDDEDIKTTTKMARISSQKPGGIRQFARCIRENWGNAKRVKLLEYLWIIAIADNRLLNVEEQHVREIAGMLYLTEIQVQAAGDAAKSLMQYDDFAH